MVEMLQKKCTEAAKIDTYEVNYEHGLLNGKTIRYTITTTEERFKVDASWKKYPDFSITLANFTRYPDAFNNQHGFTEGEVLDFITCNEECYYNVAEFVDILKERFE